MAFGGLIIEKQHCAAPIREVMLQRQNLPAVPQRISSEETYFVERVEYDASGVYPFDFGEYRLCGVLKLQFTRMKDGVLIFCTKTVFCRGELEKGNAIE
jgi:hypothetical protein